MKALIAIGAVSVVMMLVAAIAIWLMNMGSVNNLWALYPLVLSVIVSEVTSNLHAEQAFQEWRAKQAK